MDAESKMHVMCGQLPYSFPDILTLYYVCGRMPLKITALFSCLEYQVKNVMLGEAGYLHKYLAAYVQ